MKKDELKPPMLLRCMRDVNLTTSTVREGDLLMLLSVRDAYDEEYTLEFLQQNGRVGWGSWFQNDLGLWFEEAQKEG